MHLLLLLVIIHLNRVGRGVWYLVILHVKLRKGLNEIENDIAMIHDTWKIQQ